MTQQKYLSTPRRHSSLPHSQVDVKSERGSAKSRKSLRSPTPEQRRSVPRSSSVNSKTAEERDNAYHVTPIRPYVMTKQSTGSSEKGLLSSKSEFSDDFLRRSNSQDTPQSSDYSKKSNRRDTPQSSVQDSTKQYTRNARKIVEDMIRAQGYDRRIAALSAACETFDHNNETFHNIDLDQGAAHALTKQLNMTSNDDEVRMLCSALEMVFRGSPKFVQLAYAKIGVTFPVILLRILSRCEAGSMKNADITILNIWRIMLYLSRCRQLRGALCRLQGLFPAISNVSTRILRPDCRVARMRFVANIANCENNKALMFDNTDVFDSILRAAHFDSSDQVRYYAAVTLAELASSTKNQIRMVENDKLLGTIVKIIFLEENESTRESVITAIQKMAFAKENRLQIVSYKDGIVLEALKKALTHDDKDPKARRRAAGALTNLASEDTSEVIGNHQGLLDTLAIVSTKDESTEVQSRAAVALTKIAGCISIHMDCHDALLDALVVASLSKAANNVATVLRVKSREPENREALARHVGILDTLCDMCMTQVATISDRDSAARALMHLVNEDKNRKVMCTHTILDALTACAGFKDPELVDARDSAIRAMERLATELSNRSVMARHPGLLAVVAEAVEREAEAEEDGERSEHGYLAKPLLMSLLIAL